jgi:maltokinase
MRSLRELVLALPEEELREFVLEQRWYGSKSDEVVQVQAFDAFPLRDREEPLLAVAVVETRFQTGTHELYNVPVGLRRGKGGFASVDGWSAFDALEDDELVRGLVEMIRAQERVEHDRGTLEFSTVGGLVEDLGELGAVRAMGSEQSNSSVVLGEELVMSLIHISEPTRLALISYAVF